MDNGRAATDSGIQLGSLADFFSSTESVGTCTKEAVVAYTEGTARTREEEDTGEEFNSESTNKGTKPRDVARAIRNNNFGAGRGGYDEDFG